MSSALSGDEQAARWSRKVGHPIWSETEKDSPEWHEGRRLNFILDLPASDHPGDKKWWYHYDEGDMMLVHYASPGWTLNFSYLPRYLRYGEDISNIDLTLPFVLPGYFGCDDNVFYADKDFVQSVTNLLEETKKTKTLHIKDENELRSLLAFYEYRKKNCGGSSRNSGYSSRLLAHYAGVEEKRRKLMSPSRKINS